MKIALLYSYKESNWFSCTKIVKNLLDSYALALNEDQVLKLNFSGNLTSSESYQLAEDIIREKPEKLVFLDHLPHPIDILNLVFKIDPNYSPKIDIHIFGDFTLMFDKWMAIDNLLRGKEVKFYCASDAQVELVSKFFEDENHYIKKIPFPVSSKEFFINTNYVDVRKDLGIEKDSTVLLYTGRMSLQKKVIELLEVFSLAIEKNRVPDNTYLLLAGEFDTLGFTFGDVYHHHGEFFRQFDRKLNTLSNKVKSKIKFLGRIKNSNLNDFYNSADVFVSLSTYHDEDYGMSVAEAGISGMPLLLSDWAGFRSFKHGDYCELVSTRLGRFEPELEISEAVDKLEKIVKNSKSYNPDLISKDFNKYNSVEGVAKLIRIYGHEPVNKFSGFNSFLYKISRVSTMEPHLFYDSNSRSLNDYYYEVYDVYASKNK
jgi:glycosyltransferase involved in cell wall biosynthesis